MIEDDCDDIDAADRAAWFARQDAYDLSPEGIAEQNRLLLRRYDDFRKAAETVAGAWQRRHPEVLAVALIGSAARKPWKEVPRFSPYRRANIRLWHECKDVDLALWLSDHQNLNGIRKTKDRALHDMHGAGEPGVASHQVDTFLLEPVTNRYLGRLCQFAQTGMQGVRMRCHSLPATA